jgi:hypothetical protein
MLSTNIHIKIITMKKVLLFWVYILITSCSTNYYFVNIEEDTPIYQNTRNDSQSITFIPKGYNAFVTSGSKKYRKVKWKNYKGWAINPVYSLPTKSNYSSTANSTYKTPSNYTTRNSSTNSSGTVHVKGYTRKDGTYVRPHTRSAPKRK